MMSEPQLSFPPFHLDLMMLGQIEQRLPLYEQHRL